MTEYDWGETFVKYMMLNSINEDIAHIRKYVPPSLEDEALWRKANPELPRVNVLPAIHRRIAGVEAQLTPKDRWRAYPFWNDVLGKDVELDKLDDPDYMRGLLDMVQLKIELDRLKEE